MTTSLSPLAERYLRELRLGLAALPPGEREDLVAEVRSHLADRAARGDADLLAGFPAPEAYAAEFVAERALAGAIARGSSWALGTALLAGARAGAVALAIVPLGILHLVAATLVVLAALKPLFPEHVGVFVGERLWALGMLGDAGDGVREVLGWWTVPAFAIGGALLFLVANRALRAVARSRLARVRAQAVVSSP